MSADNADPILKRRLWQVSAGLQVVIELLEYPGIAHCSATNHHTICAGLTDNGVKRGFIINITVGNDRDLD